MSEPFDFLDDEEQDDSRPGIAWLPLSLAALALAGFLAIPILGLFRSEKPASDWSQYAKDDEFDVSLNTDEPGPVSEPLEPLLTPDPDDLTDDLTSVDEMLASLGGNFVPSSELAGTKRDRKRLGVTVKASDHIASRRKPGSKSGKPTKKTNVVALSPSKSKAKRMTAVQKPRVASVAGQVARPTQEMVVKPGDTLYGISRRTGVPPEEIARLNGLKPGEPIKVGQKLKIPGRNPVTGESPKIGNEQAARPARRPILSPSRRSVGTERSSSSQPEPAPKAVRSAISRDPSQAQPRSTNPAKMGSGDYSSFPDSPALPKEDNPLDAYDAAIAYRVQRFDNLNSIADALATTPDELIKLNGRSKFSKGEMLVVPVDNCLIKNE